jgi:predicted dinucleotide-binding enzyme
MAQIGNDYAKQLAGKIIIDTDNPLGARDGDAGAQAVRDGVGVTSAALLHTKRLVRAFNCINSYALTTDSFRPGQKRAVPIGGDDAEALAVTTRLVNDAGFDAIVVGGLESTRDFELGAILANRDWSVREFQQQISKMRAGK